MNNDSDQSNNGLFSSFREGFALQLSDILGWLGRVSVIAVPVLILWFLHNGGNKCIVGSNTPIVGGVITSVGLALLLGNPLIGILAGVVLGLVLNIPFIQHFLCV